MSHTTRVPVSGMKDAAALAAACAQMGLAGPVEETVSFYDGRQVTGLAVRLPGWAYPVMVEPDGTLVYDNFRGHWGQQEQLDIFGQHYTLAVALAAMGGDVQYSTTELPSGDLHVEVWQ